MVKIKNKGLKWLRFIHILTARAWFGMLIGIFVLAIICFSYEFKNEFLSTASMILKLYSVVEPPTLYDVIHNIFYQQPQASRYLQTAAKVLAFLSENNTKELSLKNKFLC